MYHKIKIIYALYLINQSSRARASRVGWGGWQWKPSRSAGFLFLYAPPSPQRSLVSRRRTGERRLFFKYHNHCKTLDPGVKHRDDGMGVCGVFTSLAATPRRKWGGGRSVIEDHFFDTGNFLRGEVSYSRSGRGQGFGELDRQQCRCVFVPAQFSHYLRLHDAVIVVRLIQ